MLSKTIWMLWFQGFDAAPDVVKSCVKSWQKHHPDWTIELLDQTNINRFLSPEELETFSSKDNLKLAHQADIIRIILLKKFGGVWVDATSYCVMPLSSWLPKHMKSDFFAFSKPGRDREISNWFMGSEKNGYIITSMVKDVYDYWKVYPRTRFKYYTIERIFKLYPPIWFTRLVSLKMRKMPYFWFHYLFGVRLKTDAKFEAHWRKNVFFEAEAPHSAQKIGLSKSKNSALKKLKRSPVYKLTWKIDETKLNNNSLWWAFVEGEI